MSDEKVVDINAAKANGVRRAKSRELSGDWKDHLLYTEKGNLRDNVANATTILTHDPDWAGVLVWDEFRQSIVTTRPPPWFEDDRPAEVTTGPWSEEDGVRLVAWFARKWSLDIGLETTLQAVRVVARRRVVHEVREYFEALRWDGERRVDAWPITYLGALDSPYVRNVGRWWLISAVARTYDPGCKADHLVVLESPQGRGKSSALRELGGTWFSDTSFDLHTKDAFIVLQGNLIIEFAELESLSRADVGRVKSFLSSLSDNFRPPYARGNVKIARRCIFAGSTNNGDYLKDETGNRRFWPITCGNIDLESLRRDRDQIWAEAREMYRDGEKWWPDSVDLAKQCDEAQRQRLQRDAWQQVLETYLAKPTTPDFVTMGDLLGDALDLRKEKWDPQTQARVGRCMRAIGWTHGRRRVEKDVETEDGDNRVYGYRKPETTERNP